VNAKDSFTSGSNLGSSMDSLNVMITPEPESFVYGRATDTLDGVSTHNIMITTLARTAVHSYNLGQIESRFSANIY